MSGAVCFRNTRVPVSFLFEHIEAGGLDEFYAGFPNVTEEQVFAVLEASKSLIEAEFQERASA